MRLEDLILRSIAKRCVSKDDAIEVEIALALAGWGFPGHPVAGFMLAKRRDLHGDATNDRGLRQGS